MTNQSRKLRRREIDQANAESGITQQPPRAFTYHEQVLFNNIKENEGQLLTSHQNIVAINIAIGEIKNTSLNDNAKIESFNNQVIVPKLSNIENKQNALIDLFLKIAEKLEIKVSDEIISTFKLEDEPKSDEHKTVKKVIKKPTPQLTQKEIQKLEKSKKK